MTGTIGSALALHLAAENDVWGIARFADAATRAKETFTRGRDAAADTRASTREAARSGRA